MSSPTAANGAARIRLALAGRLTPVDRDELALLDRWVESFDVWKASSGVAVDFSASVTIGLDELTWRLAAPTHDVFDDLRSAFDLLGASGAGLDQLARLGDQVAPGRLGTWVQVGDAGVDAGWTIPETVTFIELRAASVMPELLAWMDLLEATELRWVEGGVGGSAFVGGSVIVSETGVSAEEASRLFARSGATRSPADQLVALEQLHAGVVGLSCWFVAGVGAVKTSVAAADPSAELLVACAMATGVDEDTLAGFGGAAGSELPAVLELESWADGHRVRLHYDVRGDEDAASVGADLVQ